MLPPATLSLCTAGERLCICHQRECGKGSGKQTLGSGTGPLSPEIPPHHPPEGLGRLGSTHQPCLLVTAPENNPCSRTASAMQ